MFQALPGRHCRNSVVMGLQNEAPVTILAVQIVTHNGHCRLVGASETLS